MTPRPGLGVFWEKNGLECAGCDCHESGNLALIFLVRAMTCKDIFHSFEFHFLATLVPGSLVHIFIAR